MDDDIVFPTGEDIWKFLSAGYAICGKCGAVMNADAERHLERTCPVCGVTVNYRDYEYTGELDEDLSGEIPPCCLACGGDYPNCMISCGIFDD